MATKLVIRSNYENDSAKYDPGIDCSNDEIIVKQQFKDECDINTIVAKFNKLGQLPELIRKDAKYGDFTAVPEYQHALDTVIKAQEQFEALDANVRDRFANDPARFLEFATNAQNLPEMVKLGLAVEKSATPQPATPQVKSPATSDVAKGGP